MRSYSWFYKMHWYWLAQSTDPQRSGICIGKKKIWTRLFIYKVCDTFLQTPSGTKKKTINCSFVNNSNHRTSAILCKCDTHNSLKQAAAIQCLPFFFFLLSNWTEWIFHSTYVIWWHRQWCDSFSVWRDGVWCFSRTSRYVLLNYPLPMGSNLPVTLPLVKALLYSWEFFCGSHNKYLLLQLMHFFSVWPRVFAV